MFDPIPQQIDYLSPKGRTILKILASYDELPAKELANHLGQSHLVGNDSRIISQLESWGALERRHMKAFDYNYEFYSQFMSASQARKRWYRQHKICLYQLTELGLDLAKQLKSH